MNSATFTAAVDLIGEQIFELACANAKESQFRDALRELPAHLWSEAFAVRCSAEAFRVSENVAPISSQPTLPCVPVVQRAIGALALD